MLEKKLQQMGMSLAIGVFTDVYGTLPSIVNFLERLSKYQFYEGVLAKNIDHEGNVGLLSCDEEVVTQIRDSLIAQNIPFTIVGSEAFHAELRRFRKSADRDNENPPLPTNDEILRNEHIDVLTKDFEGKGKYTFFIPTSVVTTTLSKEVFEAYLAGSEALQNLRPEDSKILPPAEGCTIIDLILANTYANTLREEYAVKIEDKTQDIEKESPEQEEELEREIGDGSDRNVDTTEEATLETSSAPEQIVPTFTEESESPKEKKQKRKKKNNQRYNSERHERSEYSLDDQHFHTEQTTSKNSYSYEKTFETGSKESTRVGDMSVNENLAHDSFRHQEELKEREQREARQENKSETFNNVIGKTESTYRNSSSDTINRNIGSYENSEATHRADDYQGQQTQYERLSERKSSSEYRENGRYNYKQNHHNYDNNSYKKGPNEFSTNKNYTANSNESPIKRETYEYSRTGGTSISKNLSHDSFKEHCNVTVAHFDDSQKTVIEHRAGGDLSGNAKPQAKQYDTTPPPIRTPGRSREILFDNHASQTPTTWDAIKRAVKENGLKKGMALTKPVQEAVKEATMGDDTEGGNEVKKYSKNTKPVGRFITQEAKYASSITAAREIGHDADVWAKAYAATRGEPNTANAETYIKNTVKKAGLDPKIFDGKNIIEVRDILHNASTSTPTISIMNDVTMNEWMGEKGFALPDELKLTLDDYRTYLNQLNARAKPSDGKLEEKVWETLQKLTQEAEGARASLENLKAEIDKIQGEIGELLAKSHNNQQLIKLLIKKNHSQEFIDGIKNISFDALKNGNAMELIKKQFNYNGIKENIFSTKELQKITFHKKIYSTGELIRFMDTAAFGMFLRSCGMSEEMVTQVLKLGKDRIISNPSILNSLIRKASGVDKIALKKLQVFLNLENARAGSHASLASGISKRVLQNAFGDSEGSNALWETTGYLGNTRRITSSGLKISMKISNRLMGENAAISRGLNIAAQPAKFVSVKLKTAAGKAAVNSKAVMKTTKFLSRVNSLAHAPGRYAGYATRSAAKSIGKLVSTGAKHIVGAVGKLIGVNTAAGTTSAGAAGAASAAGAAAGGAAATGAAAGTLSTGWIALIILVVVLVLNAAVSQMNEASTDDNTLGNYQYTQFDTDFQSEILNELQNLNDTFEETVNRAATDRTFWSSVDGFSETDSVTFYENGAYSVYYQDEEGNELDHLDINNSKAILDLATQYCKYTDWIKPSEDASEEAKLAYEQIKQYYLDYCKFLWVSTHRITIEEYRPGDGTHANDDQSGLTTNEQGICPKNGTKVWLDKNFKPGERKYKETTYVCGINNGSAIDTGTCNRLDQAPFDNVYRDYGDYAICTHPKENLNSGWKIVVDENNKPVTQDHYICVAEHKCNHGSRKEPEYVYHHCGDYCSKKDEKVYYDKCKHTDYQWEYQCGGHMGAVIYVTVGDVSRLKDMPPAKDIDINDLSNYPENSNDTYIQEISPETLAAPETEENKEESE